MNTQKMFLVFDIGCLECGEKSSVIGVYATRAEAEVVATRLRESGVQWRDGEHHCEIFDIEVPMQYETEKRS